MHLSLYIYIQKERAIERHTCVYFHWSSVENCRECVCGALEQLYCVANAREAQYEKIPYQDHHKPVTGDALYIPPPLLKFALSSDGPPSTSWGQ